MILLTLWEFFCQVSNTFNKTLLLEVPYLMDGVV